jgi:hypothetical protein
VNRFDVEEVLDRAWSCGQTEQNVLDPAAGAAARPLFPGTCPWRVASSAAVDRG